MNPDLDLLAHRLAGALFNGLYQGIVLAIVLWVGLKTFRGINAATRHAVSFVTLILAALLPALHLVPAWLPPTNTPPDAQVDSSRKAPANDLTPPHESRAKLDEAGSLPGNGTVIHPLLITVDPNVTPNSSGRSAPPPANAAVPVSPSGLPVRFRSDRSLIRDWRAPVPARITLLLLGGTAAIAAIRLLCLTVQLIALRRLKRDGLPPNDAIAAVFSKVQSETRMSRPVQLLVSDRIKSPMAVGYLGPAVLLPDILVREVQPHDLEDLLRHELAHVQRRDDWTNLVQQLIAAILFFSPAVWWLSRRLTLEREIACDDHALAHSRSRRDYALFLTEFAARSRGRDWIAAPAAWRSRSQLKERIHMILDPRRNTSLRLAPRSAGVLTITTLAAAALALLAGPRLVFAQPAADRSQETETEDTVAKVKPESGSLRWTADASASDPSPGSGQGTFHWTAKEPAHGLAIWRSDDAAVIKTESGPGVLWAQGAPPPPEPPDRIGPPKAPRPAAPPAPAGEGIEQRLARLESMLEELVGERSEVHVEIHPPDKADDRDVLIKSHPAWPITREHEILIQKSIKDADEQVARAMKEMEGHMAEEARRQAERDARISRSLERNEDSLETQRRVLEQQRRRLERQMTDLDRQMRQLDEQMSLLDDHLESKEGEPGHAQGRSYEVEAGTGTPRLKSKPAN